MRLAFHHFSACNIDNTGSGQGGQNLLRGDISTFVVSCTRGIKFIEEGQFSLVHDVPGGQNSLANIVLGTLSTTECPPDIL